jgi:antitoxin ChpS
MASITIVLSPKQKFFLTEMIAQCDLNAPTPADIGYWDALGPSGNEIQ